jgi:hypothetical protein
MDNLLVHKSLDVRAWAETNKDRIKLFYLPPYAPDLNPDEYPQWLRAFRPRTQVRAPDAAWDIASQADADRARRRRTAGGPSRR